jgi:hypothetical protein
MIYVILSGLICPTGGSEATMITRRRDHKWELTCALGVYMLTRQLDFLTAKPKHVSQKQFDSLSLLFTQFVVHSNETRHVAVWKQSV